MSNKERIINLIKDASPYEIIKEDTELIDSGILSSMEIFILVSSIESEFNITIADDDVTAANFKSVLTIERMIQQYSGN